MANIEGLDKLLKQLNKVASDKALMKGIEKGCLRVEATAKEKSPIDTGLLRASIRHELNASKLEGIVGTNLEYAAPQEFGTVNMRAHPYLYPALKENKDKINKDITEAVRNEIKGA